MKPITRKCDRCGEFRPAPLSFFTERMWFCGKCEIRKKIMSLLARGPEIKVDPNMEPGKVIIDNGNGQRIEMNFKTPESLQEALKELTEK